MTDGAEGCRVRWDTVGAMSLNGNRFKISPENKPCPECLGYPPLKVIDGRFQPQCETCGGRGTVERDPQRTGQGNGETVA